MVGHFYSPFHESLLETGFSTYAPEVIVVCGAILVLWLGDGVPGLRWLARRP
ncbi:MAG: hypothetical protein U5K37_04015 [Natrialbaceae archaeon]|nr:hypothetical protein [Natrialbaceae archaeon]